MTDIPHTTNPSRRAVLAGTAAIVPAAAIGAPALASPDAELIALGAQLRASWDAQRAALARRCPDGDAEFDALSDDGHEIVLQIEDMHATTLEGLKVKALAVAWCVGDENFSEEKKSECIHDRALASMFRDLRAMGATS